MLLLYMCESCYFWRCQWSFRRRWRLHKRHLILRLEWYLRVKWCLAHDVTNSTLQKVFFLTPCASSRTPLPRSSQASPGLINSHSQLNKVWKKMLHDASLGCTDGRQDLWDVAWFAASGSECLWTCRGPIMSHHVDIKRRCSFLCSGFGGAKAVRGPWVPLAGLAPPGARHKAWCQLTLPNIPRAWKYPGSPSWALVPSKTCLQCTSACTHCSKKYLIVVRVHILLLFCRCRRYAVSSRSQKTLEHFHDSMEVDVPWYAEERKRRGSDWRTARNSPQAQIQKILRDSPYVLSCEGAVPAMSSKTNRMSRHEKVLF